MKSETFIPPLFLAIALTAISSYALGQAPALAPVNVALKMDMVAWGDTIKDLRISSGGKDQVFFALAFQYSKPLLYAGSNILEISRGASTAIVHSDGGPDLKPQDKAVDPNAPPLSELEKRRLKNPNLVALALLPTASRHVTVLIASGANGTYETYVIDDDPSKLPLGRLRIHNQSPMAIAVRCNGKENCQLNPKQSALVAPINQCVSYDLAYQAEGQWIMQESSAVKVGESEQAQLIILKSDASYFSSGDGSHGGFLQAVVLRRNKRELMDAPGDGQGTP